MHAPALRLIWGRLEGMGAMTNAGSEGATAKMPGRRIGVHVGTAGGNWTAVNRAREAGANTFQIFSSSPRAWKAADVKPADAKRMRELRAEFGVGPVAIHASYLINLCSQTEAVRENSIVGFRGEVERALALGAEYLVLHPGSWKGLTREEGLRLGHLWSSQILESPDFAGRLTVNFGGMAMIHASARAATDLG